jgi:hypothetical protein
MDENKITPELLYQFLVLKILIKAGGSAKRCRVLDTIKRDCGQLLSGKDLSEYQSGHGERWKNHISFAREHLKEIGYLRKDSSRGLWEITDEGRKKYKEWLEHIQKNLPQDKGTV